MKKKKGYSNNGGSGSRTRNPPSRPVREIGLKAPQPFAIIQQSTPDSEEQYSDEKQNREKQLDVLYGQLKAYQRLNRITIWGAGVSFLAFLALIYSVRLNWKSAEAAVTSADAAKKSVDAQVTQFHTDERAWIRVQLLRKPGNSPNIEIPEEGKPFSIPYSISNIGKTSARNVIVEGTIIVVPSNRPIPVDTLTPLRPTLNGIIRFGGVFPNAPPTPPTFISRFDESGKVIPITKEEIEGINSGHMYIGAFGMAVYQDIFGETHWTKFCSWRGTINEPEGFAAQSCIDINDVDDIGTIHYVMR